MTLEIIIIIIIKIIIHNILRGGKLITRTKSG